MNRTYYQDYLEGMAKNFSKLVGVGKVFSDNEKDAFVQKYNAAGGQAGTGLDIYEFVRRVFRGQPIPSIKAAPAAPPPPAPVVATPPPPVVPKPQPAPTTPPPAPLTIPIAYDPLPAAKPKPVIQPPPPPPQPVTAPPPTQSEPLVIDIPYTDKPAISPVVLLGGMFAIIGIALAMGPINGKKKRSNRK